ncbi:MAG: PAS domain-containing sensor histidine kinase, partial [Microvirga sp.]
MKRDADATRFVTKAQAAAAILLALAIFALDVLTPLQGAVAVLYVTVILIAARGHGRRLVAGAAAICAGLALAAY